jgi:uncharacterized membrane protein YfcA
LIPGVLGGILGAYVLTNLPGEALKPYISLYLTLMGVRILLKAFGRPFPWPEGTSDHPWLFGGIFDAIGAEDGDRL